MWGYFFFFFCIELELVSSAEQLQAIACETNIWNVYINKLSLMTQTIIEIWIHSLNASEWMMSFAASLSPAVSDELSTSPNQPCLVQPPGMESQHDLANCPFTLAR